MGWQDYVALSFVVAAALYLVRGFFSKSENAAPCGTACGGCAASGADEPKLVSLAPELKSKS